MISLTDLGQNSLSAFNNVKSGNISILEFCELMLENDFNSDELKKFCKKHFGRGAKCVNQAIKIYK